MRRVCQRDWTTPEIFFACWSRTARDHRLIPARADCFTSCNRPPATNSATIIYKLAFPPAIAPRKDYQSTDWPHILSLYDELIKLDDSPVVALNRAVAVANVHGAKAGIDAVTAIRNRRQLDSYYLLYAVLGEFEALLSNKKAALEYFRKSLELTTLRSEQTFMSQKVRDLENSQDVRCS